MICQVQGLGHSVSGFLLTGASIQDNSPQGIAIFSSSHMFVLVPLTELPSL